MKNQNLVDGSIKISDSSNTRNQLKQNSQRHAGHANRQLAFLKSKNKSAKSKFDFCSRVNVPVSENHRRMFRLKTQNLHS